MEYQLLNKKVKFNKDKNIGSVLYIVEGERREMMLLGYIFQEIMEYKDVIALDRSGKERINSIGYRSRNNKNSKVFIINSEKSNINSITNTKFIDNQVEILKHYYSEFNYEDIPIYYIFDCDREKDQDNINNLITIYGNSREPNKQDENMKFNSIGGMLLLSYPSIESFVISNFEKDMFKFGERFNFETQSLKKYIDTNKYDNAKMSIETLLNSFNELTKSLINIHIEKLNIDDVTQFNQNIFNMVHQFIILFYIIS